jgi:magnesium transporter
MGGGKTLLDLDTSPLLEMIANKQWSKLREELSSWQVADIGEFLFELDKADQVIVFRLLPRNISSEVFTFLMKEQRNALLAALSDEETRSLLHNLEPDDRTNLFEELPGRVTQKLMNLLSPEELEKTRELMGYPEESIGRIMTPNYVAVRPNWSIRQGLEQIRTKGKEDSETLNVIYVTDSNWKLLDALELKRFIFNPPETIIEEIMDHTFVSLSAFEDREQAVHTMGRYDMSALPVVDSEGVLLGVVTFDDVMDVAEEEATEDFHKGAAVTPLKNSYYETGVKELYRKRIGWLLALVFVNLVSLELLAAYQEILASTIALTFFIPLLIGSGGNAGAQSATLMVRALGTGDIEPNQWLMTLLKELSVGAGLGLTMGLAAATLGIIRGGMEIAIIVCISMITIIMVANIIGVMMPFILTKMNLDPAVASNPLITSITDATGLSIYLAISTWILHLLR